MNKNLSEKTRILIDGMYCASCALLIKGNLKKIKGILSCNMHFLKEAQTNKPPIQKISDKFASRLVPIVFSIFRGNFKKGQRDGVSNSRMSFSSISVVSNSLIMKKSVV